MADLELVYRLHARQRMAERNITPTEVRSVLEHGELVERRHPEGRPFPTRLLLGWSADRPLHVLVADDDTASRCYVITVYEPTPDQWENGFRTRKEQT